MSNNNRGRQAYLIQCGRNRGRWYFIAAARGSRSRSSSITAMKNKRDSPSFPPSEPSAVAKPQYLRTGDDPEHQFQYHRR
jgi:hypothetical protein